MWKDLFDVCVILRSCRSAGLFSVCNNGVACKIQNIIATPLTKKHSRQHGVGVIPADEKGLDFCFKIGQPI
jgi:hypothetical protein